jgi:hypothetical protein
MDDEQKRRAAGICAYNCLGLLTTAAFICAIYSYAFCDFAERYVTLQPGITIEEACTSTGFESTTDQQLCQALLNPHGVGFEGFWVTVPVNTQFCSSYTVATPRGFVTPEFDTKFNSARALSITGIVLGGAAWLTLMMASCCKLDQARMNGLACYFFLATLFQGLSLLLFRSNVCEPGFFSVYFSDSGETITPDFIQSVTCGLSTGSKLAIAATVLYFVCHSCIPAAIVPEPFMYEQAPPTQAQAAPQNADSEA